MISVRVKTQMLEIAVSSDNSSLGEVVESVIKVGQSPPVQASLQEPIILKQLPPVHHHQQQQQAELPAFVQQQGNGPVAEPRQPQKKKPANGKGEGTIAYEKILELKTRDFFNSGSSKNFAEIQSALSTMGYTIKDNRLGEALLKLVRDGHLAREGKKNSYAYRAPPPS